MKAENFTTSILVDQTAKEVFDAINNVRGWWQGEITGNADRVGDEFDYRMLDIHYSRQKVAELVPNKKVVWNVTDSQLSSFTDKNEWTGTQLVFEIRELDGKTQLQFTHHGLVPEFECYGSCSGGWSALINQSLLSLITTGKGVNVFG